LESVCWYKIKPIFPIIRNKQSKNVTRFKQLIYKCLGGLGLKNYCLEDLDEDDYRLSNIRLNFNNRIQDG